MAKSGFGETAQYGYENGVRVPLFGSAYEAKQKALLNLPTALPGAKTPTGYAVSPNPTSGQGPFGAVPGQLGLPDPRKDLSGVFPNLDQGNAALSNDVLSELHGTLSPETQAAIQDAAARFGVGSGMPGSGLQNNRTVRDLGLSTEALQHQGIGDYLSALTGIKNTQTVSPELQNEIATQNSLNKAAPDPTQAASYAKQLFDQYLSRMRGPAGGTTGVNPGASYPGAARPSTPAAPAYTNPFRPTTPATQSGTGAYTLSAYDPLDPGGEFDNGNFWSNQLLPVTPGNGAFDGYDPLDPGGEFAGTNWDQDFYDQFGF